LVGLVVPPGAALVGLDEVIAGLGTVAGLVLLLGEGRSSRDRHGATRDGVLALAGLDHVVAGVVRGVALSRVLAEGGRVLGVGVAVAGHQVVAAAGKDGVVAGGAVAIAQRQVLGVGLRVERSNRLGVAGDGVGMLAGHDLVVAGRVVPATLGVVV